MNLPLFISRKYFFSKKVSGVVHIIAGISLIGIMFGSFALIVILSSFNGFEEIINKMYNTFDSDIKITPVEGKYFALEPYQLEKIKQFKQINKITPVIEENVLLKYNDKQTIATIKGIEPAYLPSMGLDTLISGDMTIYNNSINYILLGAGVASRLDVSGKDDFNPITVFEPKRGKVNMMNPDQAFNKEYILPSGYFSTLEEFDNKFVLVPIQFARGLVEESKLVTSYEINLTDELYLDKIKKEIQNLCGDKVKVKDRFEQQSSLYKVMKSEKFATYLILSFVIVIAAFNLIGCLLMLSLEKRKDMMTLFSLGGDKKLIEQIIIYEGMLISGVGSFAGIFLGTLLCWIQMETGFVKLAQNSTFVYSAYPIAFKAADFVVVILTVLVIGFLASWVPAKTALKNISVHDLKNG